MVEDLYQQVTAGLSASERKLVQEAADYSISHLSSIKRRTGISYAQHCLEVACTLRQMTTDPLLLRVALLHDLLVHDNGLELLQRSPLEAEENQLVHQMQTLRRLHIDTNNQDLDSVMTAFMEHEALLPLRMAHRVNDIRCIQDFEPDIRNAIARETLHMYGAIAGRLGMHSWRVEMENTCFQIVHPKIAKDLMVQFAKAKPLDELCLEQTEQYLAKALKKAGVKATFSSRIKSLYSTYYKMIVKDRVFSELSDRLATRIIVNDDIDCYKALGVVHATMKPQAGKLKDYIGAPKENGYQSIHTVVYPLPGVTELPIEIQIRTTQMHHECEYGQSAHVGYKFRQHMLTSIQSRAHLFARLQVMRQDTSDPEQFADALRTYFQEDTMVVFDGEGELYHLPKPATALDFVCLAYGKRSSLLREIRINGRVQPFSRQLQDGDTIEAKFSRTKQMNEDWLKACFHRTSKKLLTSLQSKSATARTP